VPRQEYSAIRRWRNRLYKERNEMNDSILAEKLARDPHRPRYHFVPPAHWMNDPNGLIYWKGEYHLFYQHNPNGAFWGTMHWGHAVSRDLVHWWHLPIALVPTPGGPDKDGCFSGCAVDHDGTPALLYTGVSPEVQCLATGTDDLLTWRKHPGNPVIAAPPPDLAVTGFRDPWVWREGETWQMLVGSGIEGVGGAILLYQSPDLVHWRYVGPIFVGDRNETGQVWECPGLFPLGNRYLLIFSPVPLRQSLYFLGSYANGRFTPDEGDALDWGGHFYAPQTLLDAQGRRVMFGWLWEGREEAAQREAGWAGVQSLPRVLALRPDGALGIEPLPELGALRGRHIRFEDLALSSAAAVLPDVEGDCLELIVEVEVGDAREVVLAVRVSPGGEEETRIVYDLAARRLTVDRERSSLSPDVHRDAHGGLLSLARGEPLRLHVFLDRSVVEVYANGWACLTSRIYPSRPDSLGVSLFARGGSARARSVDAWEVRV
jgi:beta-fructofuranosidase